MNYKPSFSESFKNSEFGKFNIFNIFIRKCLFCFQMFLYKDIVVILLLVIRHSDVHERSDNFLQRLSLYLLNNVVRSVDNVEKLLVGDQGAVKVKFFIVIYSLSSQSMAVLVCDQCDPQNHWPIDLLS